MIPLRRAAPLLLALLLAAPAPGAAEEPPARRETGILLRNATVLTLAGDPIAEGGVLIREGKIASVGRNLPTPEGATVVDCTGRFVVPGFLDAGAQVGLVDIDLVRAANDSDDGSEPSTPDLDVRDGVNIESPLWAVARAHGVTSVLVHPQDTNVINGRGALFHCLDGAPIAERTVLAPTGLHVTLGASPKERFAEKDRMPSTRMGVAAVLRREFARAQDYREKWRRWEEKRKAPPKEGEEPPAPPARDPGLEVLAKALQREIPVFAGADRLDDLRTAIRIGEEFNLRLVLFGAAESWKMAKELAEKRIPVVLGPVVAQPDSPERPGARMDAARLLHEAGVPFCIRTGDAHNARNLPYQAGIAASWGLPEAEALAAITRNAARILGVGDSLGTIESGKEATLCVFQGSPLEPLSRLERMYIRGREVSLRSRQTDLYEKWK
jgi:imidazolonepropionase-like amidohydrolase